MSGEELPEGWAEVRIADVCAVNPRDDHLDDEVEVTFVPMAAVSDVTGAIERPEVRKTQDVRKGFTSFVDDDVIFAKITPCMENGKSAVARGLLNGRGYGSTEFVVLRSKGGIEPSFLHRFVRQDVYRREARGTMQSGVGQARVPKEFIENTTLMLPPLPEQKRIVARLDALQARSRAAREALAEVPALLDTFRQSVLAAAFRGDLTAEWRAKHPDVEPASKLLERIRAERKRRWEEANPKKTYVEPEPVDDSELPELPEGWVWAHVELLCEHIVDCLHRTPAYVKGPGYPAIRTADVEPGVMLVDRALLVDHETYREQIQRLKPKVGDVFYSREGARFGVAACVPAGVEVCISQRMMHFRVERDVDPEFFMWALNSPIGFGQAQADVAGSASPHVNIGSIRRFVLPVAGMAEQRRIAFQVGQAFAVSRSLESALREGGAELDTLDQSILARAFRGELVEQDPDDEPADLLLARLRAGAEAPTPRGRGKRKG